MKFSFEKIVNNELKKVVKRGNITEARVNYWDKRAQQDALDAFYGAYNKSEFENDDERERHNRFVKHVDNTAKMNNVNINHDDTPIVKGNVITYGDDSQETFDTLFERISEILVVKAEEIKQVLKGKKGAIDRNVMFAHNPDWQGKYDDENKPQIPDNVDVPADLMRYRDLLDDLALSWMYDENNKQALLTKQQKFGIVYNKLKNEDGSTVIETICNNFNLAPSVTDIIKWATQGTIYGKLKDQEGFRDGSYGAKYGDKSQWTDEDGNLKYDEIKQDYYQVLVQRILNNLYGINLEMPGTPVTYGNAKLPNDSLIINFTSAHHCPAWNECLVKYACYARTSEHAYPALMAKNKRLNVMWEGCREDGALMDAMKNLIRCACISISSMATVLKNNVQKGKSKYTAQNIYGRIKEEGLYTFNEEEKSILLNNLDKVRRVKDIRLNEEGDFIGQWLLDAIDDFAGELKIFDINTTAYTCRNLNFDGIKNIVVNASLANIGGIDGSEANAIARRFYAVSPEEYASFGETYASEIDGEGNPVGTPTYPTYITNEAVFGDNFGHVVAFPQPLYLDGKPTGQLYYKCPCGRGKHGEKDLGWEMGAAFDKLVIPDGTNKLSMVKSKKKKSEGTHAVDCYDCRMCYLPKSTDKPLIVLVQVHSANAELFDQEQAEAIRSVGGKDYGKSSDYAERRAWVDDDRQNKKDAEEKNKKKEIKESVVKKIVTLNENFQNKDNDGLHQVAQNAIDSVHKHLGELSHNINEQKTTFMNILENIQRY